MSNPGLLWPWFLLLLPATALLVVWYRRSLGRSSKAHTLYPDTGLAALAAPRARRWQHLPALGYLAVIGLGLLALARPTADLLVPDDLTGVMLAIETSNSMRAGDIAPNRMAATRIAAKALLDTIPGSVKVGLATFSGYGVVAVPPTYRHQDVETAIDRLGVNGNFAFSHGLIASLQALPEESEAGTPGAIVLFSHGHDNSGNDPLAIADEAARRGIRIHTIGVGTHGNNFDDDILKLVADRTGGQYYPIFSAGDLEAAHRDLGRVIALRPETTEVTSLVALAASLLLMLSLGGAQLRRRVM